MNIYDEAGAVEAIGGLSVEARMHLSHVVRNGMAVVLSAARLGHDVEKAVFEFESRWKELGL